MRAALTISLIAIFSGCAKTEESPGWVVRQFIRAVVVDADWKRAESLSDSLAKIKIQNFFTMQSILSDSNTPKMTPVGFSVTDSTITDSLAVFHFHFWVTDSVRPDFAHESGFVRMIKSIQNHWRITDFGYIRTGHESRCGF